MSYQANLAVGSLTLSNVPAGFLQTNGSGLVSSTTTLPPASTLTANGVTISGSSALNGPNTLQVQGSKTVFNDGINPQYTTIIPGVIDAVSAVAGPRFIGGDVNTLRGVALSQFGTVSRLDSGAIGSVNANTGDTPFFPGPAIITYDSSTGYVTVPVLNTVTGAGTTAPYQFVLKDSLTNLLPLISGNTPAFNPLQIGTGGVLIGVRDFATILTPMAPTLDDSLVVQPQVTQVGDPAPLQTISFSGTTVLTFPVNSNGVDVTNIVLQQVPGRNQYYNIKVQAVGVLTGFPLATIDATVAALYGNLATGGFEATVVSSTFGYIAGTSVIPTNPITGLTLTSTVNPTSVTLTVSITGANFETKSAKVDVVVSYV